MALDRTAAAEYLAGKLGVLFTDAGIPLTDSVGGLREPIDEALLMTGSDYATLTTATVTDANALGFFRVLRYTGLKQVYDAVKNRVDIQLDGPQMSKNRSQFVRQLENSVEKARKEAEPFIVDGVTGFSRGVITLDTIEPYPAWG